ncbi:hypothetical protein Glove_16g14 [Diversispora epigaea]|uniref:Uncharacterized protein n=1 Tax=Diversispora epigaea TaxID=1348612 RepID=A0A397JR60_9GLOM|nr:hypothetical protein Glove_16g14 [Diversispora epigaea]
MWKRISGKLYRENVEEILRYDYYGEIGKTPKNTFYSKPQMYIQKNDDDNDYYEEEEFKRKAIEIKIDADQNFESTFLKILGCRKERNLDSNPLSIKGWKYPILKRETLR